MTLFTEVFPVVPAALPKLFAWRLDLAGADYATVGGKLSYRLRGAMGGHWVWAVGRVLTDVEVAPEKMSAFLETLWKDYKETFKNLRGVDPEPGWVSSAQAQADFASRGLLADADKEIRALLAPKRQSVGDAQVERVYETRGWVVDGAPAVSVSVFSRLVCQKCPTLCPAPPQKLPSCVTRNYNQYGTSPSRFLGLIPWSARYAIRSL